ncbi:MAG: hypothetical protein V9E89_09890 [Ilumatobacteraceae bacterium]
MDSDSDSERSDGGTGGGVTMLEHAGGQEVAASSLPPPSWGEAFVQGRECAWCATPFVVVRRPGRPRLYSRAYLPAARLRTPPRA